MSKSPVGKINCLFLVFCLLLIFSCSYTYGNTAKDNSTGKITAVQSSDTTGKSTADTSKIPAKLIAETTNTDSVLYRNRVFKSEELVRGERLFFGLAYQKAEAINCASCHNTRESDTLNWNPDALEISKKYLHKNAADLNKILLKPVGQKMTQVHRNFHLIPEDVVLIKAYMDRFVEIGLSPEKPVITNLLLFIIASVLLLFSLTDLIITKKLEKKWIHFLIIPVAGGFITYMLVINALSIGRSKDYSPVQPIKFSHAVHAGQNGTDCIYCHSSAPYSKTAGIPPENVCMNCHLMVRNGTRSGAFEIAKIVSAYENQKPIEWIKIHNLPDHVFFSHAQHVSAAGLNCRECHGDVQKMDIVKQVSDLSMGWCIDCHRTKKLDVKSNQFYSQYRELAEKVKKGQIDSITEAMMGGRECGKCHY
jgi:hypothetical protein